MMVIFIQPPDWHHYRGTGFHGGMAAAAPVAASATAGGADAGVAGRIVGRGLINLSFSQIGVATTWNDFPSFLRVPFRLTHSFLRVSTNLFRLYARFFLFHFDCTYSTRDSPLLYSSVFTPCPSFCALLPVSAIPLLPLGFSTPLPLCLRSSPFHIYPIRDVYASAFPRICVSASPGLRLTSRGRCPRLYLSAFYVCPPVSPQASLVADLSTGNVDFLLLMAFSSLARSSPGLFSRRRRRLGDDDDDDAAFVFSPLRRR